MKKSSLLPSLPRKGRRLLLRPFDASKVSLLEEVLRNLGTWRKQVAETALTWVTS